MHHAQPATKQELRYLSDLHDAYDHGRRNGMSTGHAMRAARLYVCCRTTVEAVIAAQAKAGIKPNTPRTMKLTVEAAK